MEIKLVPFGRTFRLPKNWILAALPDSIFASALKDEPDLATFDIPNAVVTPAAMEVLVDLSKGREPVKHVPDLIMADQYLGIPSTLYYADSLYDRIPDRTNGNSPTNQVFIRKLIQKDRVWPYVYLMQKGYVPQSKDLLDAIKVGAINIVKHIDPYVHLDINTKLQSTAKAGEIDIMRLWLPVLHEAYQANPSNNVESPLGIFRRAILTALHNRHLDLVDVLLADPLASVDLRPHILMDDLLLAGVANGDAAIVARLLELVTPLTDDTYRAALDIAEGNSDIMEVLWADPRVQRADQ